MPKLKSLLVAQPIQSLVNGLIPTGLYSHPSETL